MIKYKLSDVKDDYLLKLLRDAYEAMRSEAMYCPWCTGYIGGLNTHHDQECVVLSLDLEPKYENPAHSG